jgi:hypothetical protein
MYYLVFFILLIQWFVVVIILEFSISLKQVEFKSVQHLTLFKSGCRRIKNEKTFVYLFINLFEYGGKCDTH